MDNKVDQDINTFLKQSSATTSTSVSIENPGQWESMLPVAPGTWNVIYAPHMTTMAKVFGGGEFRVQYIMNEDGTMVSHARLGGFPWLFGLDGVYLSVSGELIEKPNSILCIEQIGYGLASAYKKFILLIAPLCIIEIETNYE